MSIRFFALLALAGLMSSAAAGEESGGQIFERHCRTCHGGTAPPDSPIGPRLTAIIGTKAGTQSSGLHTRVMSESGIVWDRGLLRRFLRDPRHVVPGTTMTVSVSNADELERLLDYLETIH